MKYHGVRSGFIAAVSAASFGLASESSAQCGEPWLTSVFHGADNPVDGALHWDPDGPGPLTPQLVVGGSFSKLGGTAASGIARWNGRAWMPFGDSIGRAGAALTTWDPDGNGPQPDQIVSANSQTISRWTGAAWVSMGNVTVPPPNPPHAPHVQAQVGPLESWDPDGDGPAGEMIIAGGYFTAIGGVPANNIAQWNGAAWTTMGTGMPGGTEVRIGRLHVWDPDADGPLPTELIAGGSFTIAGGVGANRIARWNGESWSALGAGLNGLPIAMETWDPDGAGPRTPQLVVTGDFTAAGGVNAHRIARWDGGAWHALAWSGGYLLGMTTWDADGDGPRGTELYAVANAGIWRLSDIGAAWEQIGQSFQFGSWSGVIVSDLDHDGPQPPELIAYGLAPLIGGHRLNNLARWNGVEWNQVGPALDGGAVNHIRAMATWRVPGDTPGEPEQLIAAGDFTQTDNGVPLNRVARWDGVEWHALGAGVGGNGADVRALASWDRDADGPAPVRMIAAGTFSEAGGQPAARIAAWNGWDPLESTCRHASLSIL